MKKTASILLIAFIILSLAACSSKDSDDIGEKSIDSANENPVLLNQIGDELTLSTFNLKITSADENKSISSYYGSSADASEGFKFAIIALQLKNTTNEDLEFSPDLTIVDDKGREYNSYPNTVNNINNHIEYRILSPNITENGYLVYELPTDVTSYSAYIQNPGTNEVYEIKLK